MASKWVDKVVDIRWASDRKVLLRYSLQVLLFESYQFMPLSAVWMKPRKIVSMIVLSVLRTGPGKRKLLL